MSKNVRSYRGIGRSKGMTFVAPTCSCCGTRQAMANGTYNSDGSPYFRLVPTDTELFWKTMGKPICSHCLKKDNQEKGKDWSYGMRDGVPRSYLKYRKDYCENVDGRLGFKCTTTLHENRDIRMKMLDVDHINEDNTDNRPENLQTLCACCHRVKTHIERALFEDKNVKLLKNMKKIAYAANAQFVSC